MTIPSVLAIVPKDSDGCILWRHRWPSAAMRRHGYTADWQYFVDYKTTIEPKLLSGMYNLVVTPRFVWREPWMAERFRYTLSKADVTWAYEIDDDMFSPEIVDRQVAFNMSMPSPDAMRGDEHAARVRAQMEYERTERVRLMGMVDGTTVSTEPLAMVAAQLTSAQVHIVPNAMDLAWFKRQLDWTPRTIPPITVGWSGGWRMGEDVEVLAKVWATLAREFPHVRFVLHGWGVPSIVQAVPVNQLIVLPWCSIDEYPATLKNIDIGCCTVAEQSWNANKSCIKWYELSMAGAACVTSRALYGREVRDGIDGLLATTADEWTDQLRRLIVDATLRASITAEAQACVAEHHNIDTVWEQWLSAWTSIVHTRESA